MSHRQFDRTQVRMKPLAERANKVNIERDRIEPGAGHQRLGEVGERLLDEAAARIRAAREAGRPVMLAFGAHTIKNGLGPVLIALIEHGWVTHLATNGAAVIHDWELAWLGETSEDVRGGIERGEFGHWHETGHYINLAINVGAWEGLGYGESVGALIAAEGLTIPSEAELTGFIHSHLERKPDLAAAAADLLDIIRRHELAPGRLAVPHPFKRFSVQRAAHRLGVPLTGHPMFGHDIIYNHPMNCGAAIGRVAERDFLAFAESVSRIDGGVYLSVGSAVMSPMVFEKSMSMARNRARAEGRRLDRHYILVVDLAASGWDWSGGEPPETHPDYYLRYNKTFSRMGGAMRYLSADNRDVLLGLCDRLVG